MSSAEQPDLRDEPGFAALSERHRGELQVHCYRMLGSLEDAEDLVQETFLRAWRSRETFGADGRFSFRAWLYRIATNVCLDALRSRSRRVLPPDVAPPADPTVPPAPPTDLPWLQPYPDPLLDQVTAPAEEEPGAVVVARETIELTFIAAIQHLPPRQRATLILRDVLGWPAKETASLLDTTVASANSALQRARTTLRQHLGERTNWRTTSSPTAEERELLRRYVEAHESSDANALAALLREDARLTMPPHPTWYAGRAAIMAASTQAFTPAFGRLRSVPVRANRQLGAAHYLLAPGETVYRPLAVDVLRIEDGQVAEITSFDGSAYFVMFGLPLTLDR
ncbi:sigma-70 family RNA polymerase sigma factor [Actinopolymorpha sp. NPDC004070]|uniref:sigma-70 family RNA polymerase sigma factor n=1 Tax=Actinopolymorpha sp. NPDC004070 TaxID=3154548 RepID=UPI0033AB8EDB